MFVRVNKTNMAPGTPPTSASATLVPGKVGAQSFNPSERPLLLTGRRFRRAEVSTPYRLASQRLQGEVANPAHAVQAPMKPDPAVVQRLAANRLAHLLVRDVGNLLAVNPDLDALDRKSTRLNSSHLGISYA